MTPRAVYKKFLLCCPVQSSMLTWCRKHHCGWRSLDAATIVRCRTVGCYACCGFHAIGYLVAHTNPVRVLQVVELGEVYDTDDD